MGKGGKAVDAELAGRIGAVKAEKRVVQAGLREYERDFLAKAGRPVKYVKDLAPIMAEYTKYKALKAQLKELLDAAGVA